MKVSLCQWYWWGSFSVFLPLNIHLFSLCACCLSGSVFSTVQPDPRGAPCRGYPGRPDKTIPGNEQRRLRLHLGRSLKTAPSWLISEISVRLSNDAKASIVRTLIIVLSSHQHHLIRHTIWASLIHPLIFFWGLIFFCSRSCYAFGQSWLKDFSRNLSSCRFQLEIHIRTHQPGTAAFI